MREWRISDRELQELIAPALRRKLADVGFVRGESENEEHDGFFFPIYLDLAGNCNISRYEDGTWVFTQEVDVRLAERTMTTMADHVSLITERDRCR